MLLVLISSHQRTTLTEILYTGHESSKMKSFHGATTEEREVPAHQSPETGTHAA
jgi:hypothetical protein